MMGTEMWIISRKTLQAFWAKHADAEGSLKAWYSEAEKAEWKSFHDVKVQHPSASLVGNDRVVFNIKGNTYRLIVRINFASHKVFIRFVGTPAQYDKIKADKV